MLNRSKMGLKPWNTQGARFPAILQYLPRLWMVLLALAFPFFVTIADFFESLERSGRGGAVVADMMLPASVIGYMVLLTVLKQRNV